MLGGQVVALGAVGHRVVERPLVLREVAPVGGRTRVDGVGLPAVAPDRARAEHHVELARLLRLGLGDLEAVLEARAFERPLRVALDLFRQLDAEALVDGGHDVDAVRVLVADLALGLDAGLGQCTTIGSQTPPSQVSRLKSLKGVLKAIAQPVG